MEGRQYCTSGSKTAYSSVRTGLSSLGEHKRGQELVNEEFNMV